MTAYKLYVWMVCGSCIGNGPMKFPYHISNIDGNYLSRVPRRFFCCCLQYSVYSEYSEVGSETLPVILCIPESCFDVDKLSYVREWRTLFYCFKYKGYNYIITMSTTLLIH